ncbi:sulfite exporter TauE/SafE family protein [Alteromonas sp. CI.11.F.A3]|uniref:sulfite exporter TauE/SafE family protein n=1 Tax=unclassified Alteromonas TaxID=2614992 RepID=UPI001B39D40D|nr:MULTISPECIES: sulfite exporter TauE/SafE family protein [unclassified Alteromonas]MBQ4828953.1 sulfite exporter TauE/SafE family protein [Alteromonas sp. MMG017]WOI37022.1 sulfite exporter TauE/SafE family protein [Alteromonas sp. CI.11.F.A3]
MEPLTIIFVSCLVLGVIVGLLAGMLGIGGGLIIVPVLSYLLIHFAGMTVETVMPVAIATSLSTIIFTGMSSAFAHYRLGNIHKPTVLYTGFGIAIGAILGAQIASHISGALLKDIFAVLVIIIAAQMIFGKQKTSDSEASPWVLSCVGCGTGLISALMGIGGGALLVPALVWFRINIRLAIGCAAFSGLLIAIFGTASFVAAGWQQAGMPQWSLGYVYLPATAGIVTTSIFTAGIGAKLGQRVNTRVLKAMLACLLVLVSIKMFVGIN